MNASPKKPSIVVHPAVWLFGGSFALLGSGAGALLLSLPAEVSATFLLLSVFSLIQGIKSLPTGPGY